MVGHKIFTKLEKTAQNLLKRDGFRCLHISFAVRRNKIVAFGTNKNKTDRFAIYAGQEWGFKHSEMALVKKLNKLGLSAPDFLIINLRLYRGTWRAAPAAPCRRCQQFLKNLGIPKVYFSINENEFDCIVL